MWMTWTWEASGASGSGPATAAKASPTICSKVPWKWPATTGHRPLRATRWTTRAAKVDLTMAYVGTRKLFEDAGFVKAADTKSVLNGFPRVLMRLDLR